MSRSIFRLGSPAQSSSAWPVLDFPPPIEEPPAITHPEPVEIADEPPPPPSPAELVLAAQIERAEAAVRRLIAASDEEFSSRAFLLDQLKAFGVPYNAWPEMAHLAHWKNGNDFGVTQIPTEFVDFLMFASRFGIATAVEIGVWRGLSSYFAAAVLQRANPNLEYTMVDVADEIYAFDRFAALLNLRRLFPGTSERLYGQAFDLVFIDGDHSFDGVLTDYINVGAFARKMVAFHDIHGHEFDHLNGGTVRFWNELRTSLSPEMTMLEFSHHPRPWMGLGVAVTRAAWSSLMSTTLSGPP